MQFYYWAQGCQCGLIESDGAVGIAYRKKDVVEHDKSFIHQRQLASQTGIQRTPHLRKQLLFL